MEYKLDDGITHNHEILTRIYRGFNTHFSALKSNEFEIGISEIAKKSKKKRDILYDIVKSNKITHILARYGLSKVNIGRKKNNDRGFKISTLAYDQNKAMDFANEVINILYDLPNNKFISINTILHIFKYPEFSFLGQNLANLKMIPFYKNNLIPTTLGILTLHPKIRCK